MPRPGNSKPWAQKAEEDYAAAIALSRKRARPLSDVVCFHAQQCIEKYLKALLVRHRIYFPKTHDLLALCELARPVAPTLELSKPALACLKPYAVEFRYPDERATATEARVAVRQMRQLRLTLQTFLKSPLR